MKISIIHPSRSRPQMAYNTAMNWLNKRKHKVEYLLVIDVDDPIKHEYYDLFRNTIVQIKEQINVNNSCIDAINVGAQCVTGDLMVVVSDDFDCPHHWDQLLFEALDGKSDYCVKTRDLYQKTLMTLPIMDRVYYDRFKYIYYPGYRHMHSDQEMTAVAMMLGRAIELDITFEHLHYSTGKNVKDAVNVKNDATWGQGKKLFAERLATNFGIENHVIPYSDIVWH